MITCERVHVRARCNQEATEREDTMVRFKDAMMGFDEAHDASVPAPSRKCVCVSRALLRRI